MLRVPELAVSPKSRGFVSEELEGKFEDSSESLQHKQLNPSLVYAHISILGLLFIAN